MYRDMSSDFEKFRKLTQTANLNNKGVFSNKAYTLIIDPDYTDSHYSVTLLYGETKFFMDKKGFLYGGERNGKPLSGNDALRALESFYKISLH